MRFPAAHRNSRTQPGAKRPWRAVWTAAYLAASAALLTIAAIAVQARASRAATRTVTDETGRQVAIPERPVRLVSLAPSITETVYALGLGSEIVGDTDYCDFPADATRKPHVGATQNPSLERIVALKPDLVLGTPEANRRETADQLARLGIPLYGVTAHNVDDILKTIRDLGDVLNAKSAAEALNASLEARLAAVSRSAAVDAAGARPRVLFVTWYEPLITVGATSFVADVIRRAGGASISDDLAGEWPRMSLEAVVARNPDVILLPKSQSFSPSLDDFKTRPGWRDLAAVKAGHIYFVPDTVVRPSPRLFDALEDVARILHEVREDGSAGSHSGEFSPPSIEDPPKTLTSIFHGPDGAMRAR